MIHGFYLGPRLNRAFRHDIELTYEFTVSSRVLLVRKALFDCAPPGKDCILLLFSRPTVCEFSRKPQKVQKKPIDLLVRSCLTSYISSYEKRRSHARNSRLGRQLLRDLEGQTPNPMLELLRLSENSVATTPEPQY